MASVPEQLKELIEMLERGYITRKQFEEQRDRRLSESGDRTSQFPSDPMMSTEVGAYRLLGLIGEGAMGAVYRARHRSEAMADRQGGDVAVKVMHVRYARDPAYRARFEREAALGLMLNHPNIVKVHDLVVDRGSLALVMELVGGRPLCDLIGEDAGPIQWDRAWPLFRGLLEAAGYAHAQGVVHRDLKPENVLVTTDGMPRVIDFGIAKDLDGTGTKTGTGMGTVEYMAPEQYTDAKTVDRRADLYSLGMILYEMLAGRLPWAADAPQFEILEQKARKELMSPVAFCSSIPHEIVATLSPALAADPDARPATTDAFASSLVNASERAWQRLDAEKESHRPVESGPQSLDETEPMQPAEPRRAVEGTAKPEPGSDGDRSESRHWGGFAVVVLVLAGLIVGGILLMGVVMAAGGGILWRIGPSGHGSEMDNAGGGTDGAGTVVETHGYQLVAITPGSFWMGSPAAQEGHEDDETLHRVDLTVPFAIGTTEVTQELYEAVMDRHSSHFRGDRLPVEMVNWHDAVAFCNRLSEMEGIEPAYQVSGEAVTWDAAADGYRLPTEAEWEYAARGGVAHAYSGSGRVELVAWYTVNADRSTHEVAGKRANGHGLYDMSGNVWEWVWDSYGAYPEDTATDPVGPESGSDRVQRSGSFNNGAGSTRVSNRGYSDPSHRGKSLGFRLARSLR